MMEDSRTTGIHSIRCPFCEGYDLERSGEGSAHCTSCGGSLGAELLSTLWEIQTLPGKPYWAARSLARPTQHERMP